ncbi:MAG: anhydro-N-acetylmuramic acid kinase, partial [Flavobacteriales bacterium]
IQSFLPAVEATPSNERDALRTITEHIAMQIGIATSNAEAGRMLITGGGAHNTFLLERIAAHTNHELIVPDKGVVDFKEALIFAFLGVLRMTQQPNALMTVTGATRDSVGGAVYCAR